MSSPVRHLVVEKETSSFFPSGGQFQRSFLTGIDGWLDAAILYCLLLW
jgi:hypothetical protein